MLGQEATDVESNEITAIPLRLQHLELTDALVTIDAMGTQTDIADAILRGGGDYLLVLRGNRPVLQADVASFFDDPLPGLVEPFHETTDADHGASNAAAMTSATTSIGSGPTGAIPTSRAFQDWQ